MAKKTNEPTFVQGILGYVATSGGKGIKFKHDMNKWYNPTKEARDNVKPELTDSFVEIRLTNDKEFDVITLLDPEKPTEVGIPVGASHVPEKKKDVAKQEDKKIEQPKPVETPKVSQKDSEKKEETEILEINPDNTPEETKYTKQTFMEMSRVKLETAQKGPHKLTYASWTEAWSALKKLHPTANYHVHEDTNTGLPYIVDGDRGAFVKVSVTVLGLTHKVHLPVMNYSNKAAKGAELEAMLINKTIQRAFTKAIAFHGVGLYVYKGEDYPEKEGK